MFIIYGNSRHIWTPSSSSSSLNDLSQMSRFRGDRDRSFSFLMMCRGDRDREGSADSCDSFHSASEEVPYQHFNFRNSNSKRKRRKRHFLISFFLKTIFFQIKVMVDVATQTDEDVISCLIMWYILKWIFQNKVKGSKFAQ